LTADRRRLPERRFVLLALACLLVGAGGGVLAGKVGGESAAAPERFIPPRERAFDFRLRDQDGRWTSLADARGKVLVLTFLFSTCHDLCPAQADDIAAAFAKAGGKGMEVYGVSVDPTGDTPARARRFLESHGLYGGPAKFLVGSHRELAPVWRAYAIAPLNATPAEAAQAAAGADAYYRAAGGNLPKRRYRHPSQSNPPPSAQQPYPRADDLSYRGRARHQQGVDFEHSAYVMLIDKHGIQRVGLPFEQLDPDGLAKDLKALLNEP
jgi:cytochrome oxidase Cu insertion factor (SCO1/SenC/PrrC family)